jgi:hypothetical protein
LAQNPTNVELEEALAHSAVRAGDGPEAQRRFKAALARGASSWKTYWDYTRLLLVDDVDRPARVDALRRAIAGQPDLAVARLLRGRELYLSAITRRYRTRTGNVDLGLGAMVPLTMGLAARSIANPGPRVRRAPKLTVTARRNPRSPNPGPRKQMSPAAAVESDELPVRPLPAGNSPMQNHTFYGSTTMPKAVDLRFHLQRLQNPARNARR